MGLESAFDTFMKKLPDDKLVDISTSPNTRMWANTDYRLDMQKVNDLR